MVIFTIIANRMTGPFFRTCSAVPVFFCVYPLYNALLTCSKVQHSMPVCVCAVCLFNIGSFCVNDAIFQHADLMFVLTASAATAAGFANSRTISRKINCTHAHTADINSQCTNNSWTCERKSWWKHTRFDRTHTS